MKLVIKFLYICAIEVVLLFTGCASNSSVDKSSMIENVIAPKDLRNIPEISSANPLPIPPENLSGIAHTEKLTENFSFTSIKGISVVSTSVYRSKPQEDLIDVYVYEKASGQYIACIKNCYQSASGKSQWGTLGTVWSVWAKDDACYLLLPSLYLLCSKDGNEIIHGYIAKTGINNISKNLDKLRWQPQGETADYYIYSKKEKQYVTYIKNCWRQSFSTGLKGWGKQVQNAYRLITTDGIEYLIESSDYVICNEKGCEYVNGWQYKCDFIKPEIFGEPIIQKKGNVSVVLNPFRELLHICVNLTNCVSIRRDPDTKQYNDEMENYFKDYKNHEVIQFITKNLLAFEKDRVDIDRKLYGMVEEKSSSSESQVLKCGIEFNYEEFYLLLQDFAEKSDFKKFYNDHKTYYIENVIKQGFNAFENVKKWSDDFLKMDSKYSYRIKMHWSEWDDVSFQKEEIKINFGYTNQPNSVGIAHELSHIVGNPVFQKLYESDLKPRFNIVFNQSLQSQAGYWYPEPLSYFCDSFVRALAGSYMHYTGQDAKGYLKIQFDVGFIMVPAIYEKCNDFYSKKYNSLDDWYKELYKFFDSYLPK